MPLTLDQLNAATQAEAATLLDGLYEHSPWVVETAMAQRPFRSLAHLKHACAQAVTGGGLDRQLALIRAHPELAGKEAQSGTLTDDSTSEQRGAGLINLDAVEKAQITRLNADYRAKHGFPFIIAVRNYTRAQIFSEFARRLGNDPETELAACLEQVFTITRLRLEAMIKD